MNMLFIDQVKSVVSGGNDNVCWVIEEEVCESPSGQSVSQPSVLQLGEVIAHHQLERYHMHLNDTCECQYLATLVVDKLVS